MWRCGLSSDRNGLLISLWKQVTQMTNFPAIHYLEKPFFFFFYCDEKKSFPCSRGRDSLTQAILQASNWAAHPHIIGCFWLWCCPLCCVGVWLSGAFWCRSCIKPGRREGTERSPSILHSQTAICSQKHQPPQHLVPKNTHCIGSAAGDAPYTLYSLLSAVSHAVSCMRGPVISCTPVDTAFCSCLLFKFLLCSPHKMIPTLIEFCFMKHCTVQRCHKQANSNCCMIMLQVLLRCLGKS